MKKLLITVCVMIMMAGSAWGECGSGCCSSHGGVKGCDSATGKCMCNDGTPSPTCTCTVSSGSSGASLSGGSLTNRDIIAGVGIALVMAGFMWGMDNLSFDHQKSHSSWEWNIIAPGRDKWIFCVSYKF